MRLPVIVLISARSGEGGYPIIVEDIMIGAMGVGGALGGDEQCSHTALTKVLGPRPHRDLRVYS